MICKIVVIAVMINPVVNPAPDVVAVVAAANLIKKAKNALADLARRVKHKLANCLASSII